MQIRKAVLLVLAAAVFGGLMAVRHELSNIWVRALVAALAAGGFAIAVRVFLRGATQQ